jgi:hypothetical protein
MRKNLRVSGTEKESKLAFKRVLASRNHETNRRYKISGVEEERGNTNT